MRLPLDVNVVSSLLASIPPGVVFGTTKGNTAAVVTAGQRVAHSSPVLACWGEGVEQVLVRLGSGGRATLPFHSGNFTRRISS
jgi:hypothetical protein